MKEYQHRLFGLSALLFERPTSRWFLVLPIGWMCLLQFLSGIPNPLHFEELGIRDTLMSNLSHQVHDFDPDFQNLMHLPLFGMLGWLWAWMLLHWELPRRVYLTRLFGIVLGYGALNEMSQALVPRRFPGLEDLSFNWIGSMLAIGMFLLIRKRFKT
ncbi:MAG: VanZ family protein [Opitutae bacterium]|jgi:VanZ family protein|nr:VanZ family protein [Opitutae bacterium]MBT5690152.1 VanZ family protein [Opitutae bacterium]MBT6463483.1 VanZ family protein [Opitutae bacterium]MBT7853012.1 VanZ family protein [Opitutae bacterium]